MAAILMLLPGIAIAWIGISFVLTDLGINPDTVFWILVGIGLIFGMIKSKKMRIAVPITIVAILVIAWFAPNLLDVLVDLIGKGLYLGFVLIYWFLIRD